MAQPVLPSLTESRQKQNLKIDIVPMEVILGLFNKGILKK